MPRRPAAQSPEKARPDALALARVRLLVVVAFFVLGYFAVSLRLVDLTLLRAEAPARQALAGRHAAQPPRGDIYDRNGVLLATSLKMASVYADATQIIDPEKVARDLADLLPGVTSDSLLPRLTSGRRFVWLARNVTPRQEHAINSLGHPGIGFQYEYRRLYPHAGLAAHVLGYTDIDGQGIAGIERAFDRSLARGGEDLHLTIDIRAQHILRRELARARERHRAKAAIGGIVDVNTGEIIAMISLPDFDPHHPGDASADAAFNRAALGVYEMGSTFKLFPVALALESGKASFRSTFDASTPLQLGQARISDYLGKNRVLSLPEVFIYSSNIGVARLAAAIGGDALRQFYQRLGFFDPLPIPLPERGTPLYPRPWREISTLTASFGHGVAVTPLHLLRGAAALVNGGVLKPLVLVHDQENPGEKQARIVSSETSRHIRALMELAVISGTGSQARAEGYAVGGKTGTAEKIGPRGYDKKALLSSFLGVFPADRPRFAVLAMLDEPQPIPETHGYATGGWVAAPVVSRVVAALAPLYQIPPDFDDGSDIRKAMAIYVKDRRGPRHGH